MIVDPVYVLIRTSSRPRFFVRCMASVKAQTYKNIITIVHTDDPRDKYVKGNIIISSKRDTSPGRGHFNLYCNKLLDTIPVNASGWYHFLDDDDIYAAPDAIERLVKNSKRDHINVARVDRGGGFVWPKYWKVQTTFSGECIFLHTDHKDKARWGVKKKGDHSYSRQLTNILPINWIEDLIISKAQEGSGRGKRLDREA